MQPRGEASALSGGGFDQECAGSESGVAPGPEPGGEIEQGGVERGEAVEAEGADDAAEGLLSALEWDWEGDVCEPGGGGGRGGLRVWKGGVAAETAEGE